MTSVLRRAPSPLVALSTIASVGVVFSTGVITGAQFARDTPPFASHVAPSGAVRHVPRPPASAQSGGARWGRTDATPGVATGTARSVLGRVARAARLHEQATALQIAGRWRSAAERHRRAAALYGADTSAFTCLQLAGNMHFYDGNLAAGGGGRAGPAPPPHPRGPKGPPHHSWAACWGCM